MKSTIKIFSVMFGLALVMTAAYAGSGDRGEAPLAQRAAVAVPAPQLAVPEALSPAIVVTCARIGGMCLTRSVCIGRGGGVSQATGCTSGTVCCLL